MSLVYPVPAVVTVAPRRSAEDGRPHRIRAMVIRVAPEGETRHVWRIEKRGRYDGWLCDASAVALVD